MPNIDPKRFAPALIAALLGACAHGGSDRQYTICELMEEERGWYRAVVRANHYWNVPDSLILAFVNTESSFDARAKPRRKRYLGFIPGPRPSSAFGYAQALDSTWDAYEKDTGRMLARRTNFADAADFIGWYVNVSRNRLGLPVDAVRDHYLAYHEGWGGYERGTWRNKTWLINTANRVAVTERHFSNELGQCRDRLKRCFFGLLCW